MTEADQPHFPLLAIVGVTGAVGQEFLDILAARNFPANRILPLASKRSAGKEIAYAGETLTVVELTDESLATANIALLSAGGSISKAVAHKAARAGVVVIDNSSAFRMEMDVPLVIPEVNGNEVHARTEDKDEAGFIVANPNCSTIIMLMALTPIQRAFGIKRIVASTYQAASGAGAAAMQELSDQCTDVLAGRNATPDIFPEPCAFNVFSHNTDVSSTTGRNVEEEKMIQETRKIWNDPDIGISTTCIRVPVLRAHAEAINVQLKRPATESEFRSTIAAFPGLTLVDDRETNDFPTSLKAAGLDDVLVGRIRPDTSLPSETRDGQTVYYGFDLFTAGDQLRKGAALNAIQIMDLVTAPSPATA